MNTKTNSCTIILLARFDTWMPYTRNITTAAKGGQIDAMVEKNDRGRRHRRRTKEWG